MVALIIIILVDILVVIGLMYYGTKSMGPSHSSAKPSNQTQDKS